MVSIALATHSRYSIISFYNVDQGDLGQHLLNDVCDFKIPLCCTKYCTIFLHFIYQNEAFDDSQEFQRIRF